MKELELYRCKKCGNIVGVNHVGSGLLSCCGENMDLINANANEASTEKHIPVITEIEKNKYKVVVGEVRHPMTKEHYIEWIEILTEKNNRLTFFLKPNEEPEIIFSTEEGIKSVYSYCNIHGLWKK